LPEFPSLFCPKGTDMKIRLLFLLLSTSAAVPTLQAQLPDSATTTVLKDSIVQQFNRQDFSAIYAMADSSFQANVPKDGLLGLLASASTLGQIRSTEFISRDSSALSYRLIFDKRSLQLNLAASSKSTYALFGLTFYKLPAIRTRSHFLSDDPQKTPLDSLVQKAVTDYMRNKNVAGLTVGVLYKGKPYVYNFGEQEKGTAQLPTSNTRYEIGSITKTFTGILLAHAVIDGKLHLDDDIRQYLAGDYPNLQYAGQPIRIVQLSNHTSGLPSQPRLPGSNEDPFSPGVIITDSLVAALLHQVKLDTLPGTKREYSNFAVGVLGLILEKCYGLSYEQLLKKFILEPYRMNHTAITLGTRDKTAQGYDLEGKPTAYWRNRLAEPAGGIRSTADDLLLYMKAQISGRDSAANLSHRLTIGTPHDGTALNWGIYTTKKGYLRWAHDGGTDGFTSLLLIYPELNAGVVLLTNDGDHEDEAFFQIASAIYPIFLP
jgi:CubicO group peptidase (beta-lactamase class C family)